MTGPQTKPGVSLPAAVSDDERRAGAIALYHLSHEPFGPPSRGEQAEAVLIAAGHAMPRQSVDGSAPTGDNVIRSAAKARKEVFGA